MQLWVWQWFQSSVQVREKRSWGATFSNILPFVQHKLCHICFLPISHKWNKEFCWKRHQKMHRELTCSYIEETNKKELEAFNFGCVINSTAQYSWSVSPSQCSCSIQSKNFFVSFAIDQIILQFKKCHK